ncbi:hypothetical protein [Agrobacterium pusense]|uniref:hypothetical protein n=1 Tax=Agrobacterium pusense TaxID=648995 RepID=UPI0028A86D0C|nr:hypothetical protein [Agrobacterium pusense]
MSDMKEFSVSSNGDRWFLMNELGGLAVLHKANEPSGGHERRMTVADFVAQNVGKPEHDALLQLLGQSQAQVDDRLQQEKSETSAALLVDKYLGLGGRREVTIECNVVSIRILEDEPADAETFWQSRVEPLPEKDRHEVAVHLSRASVRKPIDE